MKKLIQDGKVNLATLDWLKAKLRPKEIRLIVQTAEACKLPLMEWVRQSLVMHAEGDLAAKETEIPF